MFVPKDENEAVGALEAALRAVIAAEPVEAKLHAAVKSGAIGGKLAEEIETLALAAGAVIELDTRLAQPALLAFFVALPVVASYGYLAPRYVDVSPTRPHIAIFGKNEIALLDYRIVGPLQHGATVRVNTVWQALRPVDHDYTVFVHAVDAEGKTWAQQDSKPQSGALPTTKWQLGQVIFDTYTIQIDVDGPREGYHLEFGLYVGATGERAITDSGGDHLDLPRPGDPEPTITDQLPPASTP